MTPEPAESHRAPRPGSSDPTGIHFRSQRPSRSPRSRSSRSHTTTAASASATRAALGGYLVGAVALEVKRVRHELQPALDRVAGDECVGAAAAAGEDHHVGQAVSQEGVEGGAQPGAVAEVPDPGDDDAERAHPNECPDASFGRSMSDWSARRGTTAVGWAPQATRGEGAKGLRGWRGRLLAHPRVIRSGRVRG
jgi:hypothetical protein